MNHSYMNKIIHGGKNSSLCPNITWQYGCSRDSAGAMVSMAILLDMLKLLLQISRHKKKVIKKNHAHDNPN